MELFQDRYPELVASLSKTAGAIAKLKGEAATWPQEVYSELLRRLPWLSDYEVNINLDKVDDQRGFAFGNADVTNITQRPEDEHTGAGIPHIQIPVIIAENSLKPFSVFLDGQEVLPLTEDRVREILFNPATFDLIDNNLRDPSLMDSLMPPSRSGPYMGGEYKAAADTSKNMASANGLQPQLRHLRTFLDGLTQEQQQDWARHVVVLSDLRKEGKMKEYAALSAQLRKKYPLPVSEAKTASDKTAGIPKGLSRLAPSPNSRDPRMVGAAMRHFAHVDGQQSAYDLAKGEGSKAIRHALSGRDRRREARDIFQNHTHPRGGPLKKLSFKHISEEQWSALYQNPKVQALYQKHQDWKNPEIENVVYGLASKIYGYHPKTASSFTFQQIESAVRKAVDCRFNGHSSDDTLKACDPGTLKACDPGSSNSADARVRVREMLDKEVILSKGYDSPKCWKMGWKLKSDGTAELLGSPIAVTQEWVETKTKEASVKAEALGLNIVKQASGESFEDIRRAAERAVNIKYNGEHDCDADISSVPLPAKERPPFERRMRVKEMLLDGLILSQGDYDSCKTFRLGWKLKANGEVELIGTPTPVTHKWIEATKQKEASAAGRKYKSASLLKAIALDIPQQHADAFAEKIAHDRTLQVGFKRSGIGPVLVEVFEDCERQDQNARLAKIASSILPTVSTFHKLPGGMFLVKQANVGAFNEQQAQGEMVSQEQAGEAMGPEQAQAMKPGDTATAVDDPVDPEAQEVGSLKAKPIDTFGEYKVQGTDGAEMLGWVFPNTLSWGDFAPSGVHLFTNGAVFAVQAGIAGEMVGASVNLPKGPMSGEGVFYFIEDGEAFATEPITISGSAAGPGGTPQMMATDAIGNQISITVSPGLAAPVRAGESEYAIPTTWKFMPLTNQVELFEAPEQMQKMSEYKSALGQVELSFNGAYHLRGRCGLSKISRELREDLDPVSAEFMLGLLGVDGARSKTLIKEARRRNSVKIAGLKTIQTLAEKYEEATKTAAEKVAGGLKVLELQQDLTKEAASLEDEQTVDHVLALNFISPDNLQTFIEYIPELDQTSKHIAEMLFASYLGEHSMPEKALERCMKALEETIESLKAIEHSEG
jgi:hypothetical protein